jgi:hypothetical protein
VTVYPEKLLDTVREPGLPPPPLHISGLPDPCLPVSETSALQQLRGQHQPFALGGSDLPDCHV